MDFSKQIPIFGILVIVFIAGCQKQIEEEVKTIKVSSVVLVDYAGGHLNGTLFDTSIREAAEKAEIVDPNRNYEPLQITVGSGQLIRGFEDALIGMKVGDTKNIRIPPEKAYGFYDENAISVISLEEFDGNLEQLEIGARLILNSPQGRIPVVIKDFNDNNVTLDLNHPLANKTLVFAILVRDIQ